jgi:hypothetical protein
VGVPITVDRGEGLGDADPIVVFSSGAHIDDAFGDGVLTLVALGGLETLLELVAARGAGEEVEFAQGGAIGGTDGSLGMPLGQARPAGLVVEAKTTSGVLEEHTSAAEGDVSSAMTAEVPLGDPFGSCSDPLTWGEAALDFGGAETAAWRSLSYISRTCRGLGRLVVDDRESGAGPG